MFTMKMLPDEQTRKDLMTFIKGLLREAVPAAIAEKLNENGWLEARFSVAMDKLDLRGMAFNWLKSAGSWESREARAAVSMLVESSNSKWRAEALDGFKRLMNEHAANARQDVATLRAQVLAKIDQITEERVRAIVAEELRKRLGGGQ